MLLNRRGFTGQWGFDSLQIDCFGQARVSGNLVAGGQNNEIAGHQIARGNALIASIADHGAVRRGHFAQRFDSALGAKLLNEAEDDGEENDNRDRDRLDPMAQKRRERCGEQQNDDQDVFELFEEDGPR